MEVLEGSRKLIRENINVQDTCWMKEIKLKSRSTKEIRLIKNICIKWSYILKYRRIMLWNDSFYKELNLEERISHKQQWKWKMINQNRIYSIIHYSLLQMNRIQSLGWKRPNDWAVLWSAYWRRSVGKSHSVLESDIFNRSKKEVTSSHWIQ